MDYVRLIIEFLRKWSTFFLANRLEQRKFYEDQFFQLLYDKCYDEALKLAQQHKYLDKDEVYKCKWTQGGKTVQSISHVLSKVEDKLWAINECVKVVPISYEACRTLIDFGLNTANLKLLYKLGIEPHIEDSDGGKHGPKRRLKREIEFQPLLADDATDDSIEGLIDFDRLNARQQELCRYRQTLIRYEHSLLAYESILGDYRTIQQHFDHIFYHEFRLRSPLNNCINYANDSDAEAVETLLNYYTEELNLHMLPILSNFPETTPPTQYKNLLPHLSDHETVYTWKPPSDQVREEFDWSWRDADSSILRMVNDIAEDYKSEFYSLNSHLEKYVKPLTSQVLTQWYIERALEMESRTLLTTSAIQLLSLGMELNIKDLNGTHQDLREFNNVIYDCLTDDNLYLSYSNFKEMPELDKLILMTGDSNETCKIRLQNVIRYLHRRESEKNLDLDGKRKLLRDYFRRLAETREQISRTVYNDLVERIHEDKFYGTWSKNLGNVIDEIGDEITAIERGRRSKLLAHLATQALSMDDYNACYEACQYIMKQDFKESWALCCQLGMNKKFTNHEAKYKLLAFALAHADDTKICVKVLNHIIEMRKRDPKVQEAYLRLFG